MQPEPAILGGPSIAPPHAAGNWPETYRSAGLSVPAVAAQRSESHADTLSVLATAPRRSRCHCGYVVTSRFFPRKRHCTLKAPDCGLGPQKSIGVPSNSVSGHRFSKASNRSGPLGVHPGEALTRISGPMKASDFCRSESSYGFRGDERKYGRVSHKPTSGEAPRGTSTAYITRASAADGWRTPSAGNKQRMRCDITGL